MHKFIFAVSFACLSVAFLSGCEDAPIVYIDLEGRSSLFEDQSLTFHMGDDIKTLPIPKKEHSRFEGWYTLIDGQEKLVYNGRRFTPGFEKVSSPSYEINEYVITLFAKYTGNDIAVNFVASGASVVGNYDTVRYGDIMPDLPTATREGMDFVRWFTLKGDIKKTVWENGSFVPGMERLTERNYDVVDDEITLYAEFELPSVNVTFVVSMLSSAYYEIRRIPIGYYIDDYTKDLRADGKVVTVWSTEQNDTSLEHAFRGPVMEAMTLYPAVANHYLISLSQDDKTTEFLVLEGDSFTLPTVDAEPGYKVMGWEDEEGNLYSGEFTPDKELHLTLRIDLNVDAVHYYVRHQPFSEPIYTPPGVNGEPRKRDWVDTVPYGRDFSKAGLLSKGYEKLSISMSISLNVLDDGYQWVYIYGKDNTELASASMGYEPGNFSQQLEFDVGLDKLDDTSFSVRYAAAGMFIFGSRGNEWNVTSMSVRVVPK